MQGKGLAQGAQRLGHTEKVMCTQGKFSSFGFHRSASFEDEIRFLFKHAGRSLAIATWIDFNFSETRHTPRYTALGVTLAEECLVVASGRAHIGFPLTGVRKVTMQESRIDGPLLTRNKRQRHHNEQRSHFPTTSCITRRKFPPMIFLMSGSL